MEILKNTDLDNKTQVASFIEQEFQKAITGVILPSMDDQYQRDLIVFAIGYDQGLKTLAKLPEEFK